MTLDSSNDVPSHDQNAMFSTILTFVSKVITIIPNNICNSAAVKIVLPLVLARMPLQLVPLFVLVLAPPLPDPPVLEPSLFSPLPGG